MSILFALVQREAKGVQSINARNNLIKPSQKYESFVMFSENDFSVDVKNLVPATTYYVRAFLNKLDRKFYSDLIVITTIQ